MIEVSDDIKELLDIWPMGWNFDLPENSVVVVAGSYKGRVLDLVDQVYSPLVIYGFEPQGWAFDIANDRMAFNENVVNSNFAIGIERTTKKMGEWGTDACSFVNTEKRESGMGKMNDINVVFENVPKIDLAIFNMEGYEYDLLPYMIETGSISKWIRLAVQFHNGFGNDHVRDKLFEGLEKTHEIVTNNYPQWVYWRKRATE